ncbi:Sodium/hydrogen exchanger 8 [Trichoplax sp. H2]|nr:Sodium/hydrogen exchanger 8 [Trichoplax sp. H2]|eukprot:RDD47238.1 Sodium/hydrogen exchanger 8 [Trichoplax sp. H2]
MTMRMTTTSSLLNETRFNESYFANHSTTDFITLKIINTTTLPISTTSESDITLTIFFLLLILAFCILLVYTFIKFKIHAVPESIAIIIFGAIIGGILQGMKDFDLGNWQKEEVFDPTFFFVVLLPPIIFESGYSLHKGNFFFNIGSILTFAIIGTAISAIVVGGGIYLLGMAQIIYPLTLTESFAFGSLISAVDPVATLAIFHALNVNPTLNMLVFGESVLNDAVSIVMTNSILEFSKAQALGGSTLAAFKAIGHFFVMFFASSSIGIAFALASALISIIHLSKANLSHILTMYHN